MNVKIFLEGIEGNVSDVLNNIDLVMATNIQESQELNTNYYELCVDSNNISKEGPLIMPNIDIENYVEQVRWDYSDEYNEREGGESETMTNPNRLEC
jgi:hypothetical protein